MSVEEKFRIARIEIAQTDASIQYADNLQVSVTIHFSYMKFHQQLMPPQRPNTDPYVIQHFAIQPTYEQIPFTFVFKVSPDSCEMLTCDASNASMADIPNEFQRILGQRWDDVCRQIGNTVFQHKPKRIWVYSEAIIIAQVDTLALSARSASSDIIARLETKEFKKDSEEDSSSECSICLVEFSEGQKVTLTPCSHMFHTECITKWFNRRHNCPLCRFQIDAQHQ